MLKSVKRRILKEKQGNRKPFWGYSNRLNKDLIAPWKIFIREFFLTCLFDPPCCSTKCQPPGTAQQDISHNKVWR